jgi:hypothetical protein
VPYEQVDPTDGFDELDGYSAVNSSAGSGSSDWAADDDEEAPF